MVRRSINVSDSHIIIGHGGGERGGEREAKGTRGRAAPEVRILGGQNAAACPVGRHSDEVAVEVEREEGFGFESRDLMQFGLLQASHRGSCRGDSITNNIAFVIVA